MADDKWTDEEVRYFFALYADEKKKGNRPRSDINLAGREFIINKFEEKFAKRWIWDRFKNKVDISRKAYIKFKNLTHNRTGLVYDALGRLAMSEGWWDQRIAEWQGARKYKIKVPPNMDLFEAEFGAVTVTGAEGWCAQQGEASLDSRVDAEKNDESDSVDTDMPAPREGTSRAGSSKRKRKECDQEPYVVRNAILAEKNKIAKEMVEIMAEDRVLLQQDRKFRIDSVLEILNKLPGVIMWSPFHIGALNHLKAVEGNRMAFMSFSSDDDKISYLENMIGVKMYEGL
ncbi:uncharacterized protein LOC108813582 [Raphanus sativus]|uniref:Uncharacterized protein LOC108813582 n=1 Tax=Raphanus sativus TaxID=3726 RepID=A0A9W3C1U8_RAPSA|nr:uncharacterized protein LOC108813582 [Raphanus sativus]